MSVRPWASRWRSAAPTPAPGSARRGWRSAASTRVRRGCRRPRRGWPAWRWPSSRTPRAPWPRRRRPRSTPPTTCTARPTTSARWSWSSCGARSGSPPPARAATRRRRRAFPTRWSRDRRGSARAGPAGRQRPGARACRPHARAAARRAARRPRPQGRQALVRQPGVRRLHRPGRRPRGQRVHVPGARSRRRRRPDRRRPRRGRHPAPDPARLRRRRRRAVRLLHGRDAADGPCAARRARRAHARAGRPLPARQSLPLHGVSQDRRGHRGRRRRRPVSAPPLRVVGRPVARIDAIEKVTGRARYVTDLALPGMAHARVLRSPYAHARLARVETGRARALPGVVAVLAGADLTWCDPYFGPAFRDRPILAIDVARHEGEPVAAVAAIDEPTAVAALELIDVDYEPLAAALTLEDALAPGAPLVHTREPLAGHFADLASLRPRPGTNVCHQFHFARGDAATALASADLVVEDTFRFPAVQHYALEPHAAVAAWDETGGLTVWASTQNPYSVRVELAKMFDVPLARIRIVVPHLGGGFGSKTYAKLEPLAAALAHAAGRPVRLAASAAEAFQIVRRCSARVTMRVGFGGDGTLAAVQCDAQYDVGAYADIG